MRRRRRRRRRRRSRRRRRRRFFRANIPHTPPATTNSTQVGKVLAKDSVMIAPDALHVKISICPGVSTMM